MILTAYKPKEWQQKRAALEKALKDVGHEDFTRIVRLGLTDVALEGCSLQIVYSVSSKDISIYARGGSRYAGSSYTISELVAIRGAFQTWHDEHIKL